MVMVPGRCKPVSQLAPMYVCVRAYGECVLMHVCMCARNKGGRGIYYVLLWKQLIENGFLAPGRWIIHLVGKKRRRGNNKIQPA